MFPLSPPLLFLEGGGDVSKFLVNDDALPPPPAPTVDLARIFENLVKLAFGLNGAANA